MVLTALGAFIGALLSLIISIYIEYQRKPKLSLKIEDPPFDATYTSAPAKEARFLRVHLINHAMNKWLRWLGRNAAMGCFGYIQFYHIDNGAPVFSKQMPVRWSKSDEPVSHYMQDGQIIQLFDPAKYNSAFRRDCFPGSEELIDIVARYDNEDECYGWCNDSYLPDKGWRNQDWKLPKGRYLIKVTVISSGDNVSDIFQLENSVTKQHFRLLKASEQDIAKITREGAS